MFLAVGDYQKVAVGGLRRKGKGVGKKALNLSVFLFRYIKGCGNRIHKLRFQVTHSRFPRAQKLKQLNQYDEFLVMLQFFIDGGSDAKNLYRAGRVSFFEMRRFTQARFLDRKSVV